MILTERINMALDAVLEAIGFSRGHLTEEQVTAALAVLQDLGTPPHIQRLTLEPGDYPVIKYQRPLRPEDIVRLRTAWGDLMKVGHRPIVLDGDGEIVCVLHDDDGAVARVEQVTQSCGEKIELVGKGDHYCQRPKGHRGDDLEEEGEKRHMTTVEYEGNGKKPFFW